ncbi:glycoside hydrolase family 31 protein, partial [Sodiomyces alcalophilus JCM 7366]|uniref:glycoside hydrolase family 31 protein n=1 Tax=Sodiomyces alcalophilus JCM 7366 TaxID=591952 RepID=UPI0039B6AC8A
ILSIFTCLVSSQNGHGECKGYVASNILETDNTVSADLDLIGSGCDLYSPSIPHLTLLVEYQTDSRLHVLIQDRGRKRYQVPEDVFPRPPSRSSSTSTNSLLSFDFTPSPSPFSFSVTRTTTGESLFNSSAARLVFEDQFLRLRTSLPPDPNVFGLGEHFDSFRLPNRNYTRTLWARDVAVPRRENLYGSHPIYVEQRATGTHGVFLLNSNGMDILINEDDDGSSFLEYRAIGGVLDFYFLAGPTPVEVARQYARVAGSPAIVPYWSLGFHQCKHGYRDWFEVAEVVANYSAANIPLETMWTDIDYMDRRRVFSLDPERFPINRMQEIVHNLHRHQQQYILMVDPAVAHADYPAFSRGSKDGLDIFLKSVNSDYFKGVVWPGVTVFPDWYHPNVTKYWNQEFEDNFNPWTGVDIDGVWIDMNEPANFCIFPCQNPEEEARRQGMPPEPPPDGYPPIDLLSGDYSQEEQHRLQDAAGRDEDLLFPPYRIANGGDARLDLSYRTVDTDVAHYNGLTEYNLHNLYGSMMGMATREAMFRRRPSLRPFIVARSTFSGAGRYVAKWLGDNASRWDHYRSSIAGMLAFASIFQIPMVGSDVCGFQGATTEQLCARWTTLGAFMPFFRNHAQFLSPHQEFYRWPLVASAARRAIALRYRLLDYFYTALHAQSSDGTPAINPLWYLYPSDASTFAIDLQYFYGDCLLVSPVTEEGSTEVMAYFPDDVFYDLEMGDMVRGRGGWVTLRDVPFDRIPLHVRGGCVVPMRTERANTTAALREKPFELVVAPGLDGTAEGTLFVDDGVT